MICLTTPFGLIPLCWGAVLNSLIALVINTHYTGKLIHMGFSQQIRDLLPTIFYSFSMGALVWIIIKVLPSDILRLTVGIAIGVIYFLIITRLTNSADLREFISFIKSK